MKAHLLVVLLALGACGKKNDLPILQHEAGTLAKYYQPKLDELDQRIQAIMKRGQTIPADFPGVKEVGLQLQEARDQVAKLRGLVGSPTPDQKSAIEKQAEAAANAGKIGDLRKLLHDSEVMLDQGTMLIRTDLDAVDSWLYHYDHKTLAMNAPAPTGEQPGQPETPATGQPPAAGSAAAPAQGSAAPAAQGSAASPQPAQPKQPSQPKPPTTNK